MPAYHKNQDGDYFIVAEDTTIGTIIHVVKYNRGKMVIKDATEKALSWLKTLPRISLSNIRHDPGTMKRAKRERSKFTHGRGTRNRGNYPRPCFGGGTYPFHLRFTKEPYYQGFNLRRQYPPMSLLQIQKLIDTDRINTSELIDLSTLCNTGIYTFDTLNNHFGVHLTDEGLNKFSAKIDIEVQWASESVIAAIERLGGSITLAYYDVNSLIALRNPEKFFMSGKPIPRRLIPPDDIIQDYINPKNRGYLADPQEIEYERGILAQKYGYKLVKRDPPVRKDPRQVFLGLQPGWIVNLSDKVIIKPKDPELIKYYTGPTEKLPPVYDEYTDNKESQANEF